ncbi:hypothetical protein NQ315_005889 [Exocentrus adspersus]|uniref:Large ribosomal subunit protein uL11 n=1 Tax=Exocentrus adspersus TaxID=1586481 RepID=A0AAV8V9Q1_9CUCU|nr:hypothetical protein NQ315_005889 [Exocentrus adspersus]
MPIQARGVESNVQIRFTVLEGESLLQNLTVRRTEGRILTGGANQTFEVEAGTVFDFPTAAPNAHFRFARWEFVGDVNGATLQNPTSQAGATVTMGTSATTVQAVFERCMKMAKEVKSIVKLQIPAGKANPAPPVGPALGQAGVNIQGFCQEFNDRTREQMGSVIPVVITVFEDRSFEFITKTPPASDLLKKAAGIEKGSQTPHNEKVATISSDKIREIAEVKMPDLNANTIEAAMKIIEGSARQMGIVVQG